MGIQVSNSVATYIGLAAARPGANTVPIGALYIATDTGVMSRSDGQTWTTVPIGSGALSADSVGATQIAAGAVGNGELASAVITSDKEAPAQVFTGAGSIDPAGARDVVVTSTGYTVKLPAATVGRAFRIITEFDNTNGALTLQRSDAPGTDTFAGGTSSILMYQQSIVEVYCRTAGVWRFRRRHGDQAGAIDYTSTDTGGAGDRLTCTGVAGDNVHGIDVAVYGYAKSDGAASTGLSYYIRDGAGGTGNVFGRIYQEIAGTNYRTRMQGSVFIPPFTGTKTLYASLQNTAGTPWTVDATVGYDRYMRPTWSTHSR